MGVTERVMVRFPRFDPQAGRVLTVEEPRDISPLVTEVRIPMLQQDCSWHHLVLVDCGRRDRFGNRVFESVDTAVRH